MEKKRIGIITIFDVDNYGAELQAFALQHKLRQLGHDAELIRYLFGKHPLHQRDKNEKIIVPLDFKKKLKVSLLPLIENLKTLPFKNTRNRRRENFDNFHKSFSKTTTDTYPSVNSLNRAQMDYDVYCVGSDQVWNYTFGFSLSPYFLDFVPPNKKKISFASSFGVSELPDHALEEYKKGLGKFDSLAVREESGAELVKKITGKKATVVLDPTLLLNKKEWSEFSDDRYCPNQPYLLLYVVTLIPSKYARELAKKIASEHKLKIVRICRDAAPEDYGSNIINIRDAGPSDFVGLIKNASFVVTNSFHGTVFSINFSVPFYSIVRKSKNNNSRLSNILKKVKLQERLVFSGDSYPDTSKALISMDEADEIIGLERKNSEKYLIQAISC
ncbi:polysaccharide pyruvyl transferase family protein [Mangrovibacterium diazotrophicum]|nr:polysaccharide pyruvyl transferase family protein [Mangrovibacterium diazotrophicum]